MADPNSKATSSNKPWSILLDSYCYQLHGKTPTPCESCWMGVSHIRCERIRSAFEHYGKYSLRA